MTYYREFLRTEMTQRRRKNPRYSLRAYARSLDIDPSALSRILSGRRCLSVDKAVEMVKTFDCADPVKHIFLESVVKDHKGRELRRAAPETAEGDLNVQSVHEDQFAVIADWHHYAILELTFLKSFRDDPTWIAERLGLAESVICDALERLQRVGLLVREGGRLKKSQRSLHAKSEALTSAALRRHQRQVAAMAAESIDDVPAAERAVTTMLLPADPVMLQTARRMLEDFAWQLCHHMARGSTTELYALSVNLFPISKRSS